MNMPGGWSTPNSHSLVHVGGQQASRGSLGFHEDRHQRRRRLRDGHRHQQPDRRHEGQRRGCWTTSRRTCPRSCRCSRPSSSISTSRPATGRSPKTPRSRTPSIPSSRRPFSAKRAPRTRSTSAERQGQPHPRAAVGSVNRWPSRWVTNANVAPALDTRRRDNSVPLLARKRTRELSLIWLFLLPVARDLLRSTGSSRSSGTSFSRSSSGRPTSRRSGRGSIIIRRCCSTTKPSGRRCGTR